MSGNRRRPTTARATARAKTSGHRPRRLAFGPGTILALLGLGVAAVVARVNQRADAELTAGPIVYRSDGHGHLRPVAPSLQTNLPAPKRPLWKPEPGDLLKPTATIVLTEGQKYQIGQIDRLWRAEKESLQAAMRDASAVAADAMNHPVGGRGASLQVIQRGMGDYSELSSEYDRRRADHWRRAASVLTPSQLKMVELRSASPTGGAK